jgi:hypothetical protein
MLGAILNFVLCGSGVHEAELQHFGGHLWVVFLTCCSVIDGHIRHVMVFSWIGLKLARVAVVPMGSFQHGQGLWIGGYAQNP